MAYPHYRSQFGDTTFTKVFVGGLAWETQTEEMRRYFEQFGEILEAVIIKDKNTGKSKGYGFITFRDPESARRSCVDPNPVIDGRRANCNIASLGRPRPSPPRGRPQGGNPYPLSAPQGAPSYSGVATPLPPPPPPPPVIYPHYGYQPYTTDYGYPQVLYNTQVQAPQYYPPQVYGASSSTMASPYYYGYSLQSPRGAFSAAQAQRAPHGPPYFYYPTSVQEGPFSPFPSPPIQPTRHPFPSSTDQSGIAQEAATEIEADASKPEGPSVRYQREEHK
ncbi:hypothetical protein Tsubulata_033047 [Turnera subulata]|uniref:RRM domain-containing protein n=1 Tax=Turnera subulata TaxID=218843 RepID=A0A9Q0FLV9_9ROSI|nr:hypothetical protein Tsubulata_033047 [Turnera subulata]